MTAWLIPLLLRHLVDWLCYGGADARAALVPGRKWNRPISGNNQGARNAVARANQDDEPKLHGTQVPTDQTSSFLKSA